MPYKLRTMFNVVWPSLLGKPVREERLARLMELMLLRHWPVHLAYHPDDFTKYGLHADFQRHLDKFTEGNAVNNSGDIARLWALILNIKDVVERKVPGNFAELGVWRANTAAILAAYAEGRKVYLFDTFEGFDQRDLVGIDAAQAPRFSDTSLGMVRSTLEPYMDRCVLVQGYFPGTLTDEHSNSSYAVVSLDCDLREPMVAALDFFYPRLSAGGLMFVHDYGNAFWPGVRSAVDAFCERNAIFPIMLPDKSGSAVIRKVQGPWSG